MSTSNPIRQQWAAGQPVLNAWLSIPNSFTAELMAHQRYDALTIDMQHGLIDYQVMLGMLQAIHRRGPTPLVRVPWLDAAHIMKTLDAGVRGIICPMIDNRAQAEQLVSFVRYPPQGQRSFGPTRASLTMGADYAATANADVLCFAMIETRSGMENLREIVTTPGLDAIYVGPSDLTLGLTGTRYRIGLDRTEPEMIEALRTILAAAHGAGIKAALHCATPNYAAQALEWGFDLVTLANDVALLRDAASASIAALQAQRKV